MNTGDIVMVIDDESLPKSLVGSYGIVKYGDDHKVMVEFKASVGKLGSFSHTAVTSDLKKVGTSS